MGGYAHFGAPGVVFVSLVAGCILGFVDRLCGNRFFLLGGITCAFLALKWAEQLLHTSIISGGVLSVLLFLYLCVHSSELRGKWGQESPMVRKSA